MCKVKKPKEFSGFCMNSEIMNGRLMGKAAAVVCRQQPLSQFLGITMVLDISCFETM